MLIPVLRRLREETGPAAVIFIQALDEFAKDIKKRAGKKARRP
jgi:hypothetical protein